MEHTKAFIYVNEQPSVFGGFSVPYGKAKYVIIGAPLDMTSTFKSGHRFAPSRIREVSEALESFSIRVNADYDECQVHDLGDIAISPGNIEASLHRIKEVVEAVREDKKVFVLIGGEHLITYPVINAIRKEKPCLIVFDAHFDLRDNYLGSRISHATVMRRISEIIGLKNILFIGVRAFCSEEAKYVKYKGVEYVESSFILRNPVSKTITQITKFLRSCDSLYVSIDMDVFDPAYAPAVGNPEPEGLTPTMVLDILNSIVNKKLIGFDIVEIVPLNDVNDVSSLLAAKIIMEAIVYHKVRSFK